MATYELLPLPDCFELTERKHVYCRNCFPLVVVKLQDLIIAQVVLKATELLKYYIYHFIAILIYVFFGINQLLMNLNMTIMVFTILIRLKFVFLLLHVLKYQSFDQDT